MTGHNLRTFKEWKIKKISIRRLRKDLQVLLEQYHKPAKKIHRQCQMNQNDTNILHNNITN